jgi:hypothetical protein
MADETRLAELRVFTWEIAQMNCDTGLGDLMRSR